MDSIAVDSVGQSPKVVDKKVMYMEFTPSPISAPEM
jgi:hypothetical protein